MPGIQIAAARESAVRPESARVYLAFLFTGERCPKLLHCVAVPLGNKSRRDVALTGWTPLGTRVHMMVQT